MNRRDGKEGLGYRIFTINKSDTFRLQAYLTGNGITFGVSLLYHSCKPFATKRATSEPSNKQVEKSRVDKSFLVLESNSVV